VSLAVISTGSGDSASTTATNFVLRSSTSNLVNSVAISHVYFSAADPTAIIELTIGRTILTGSFGGVNPGGSVFYFGSDFPQLDSSSHFQSYSSAMNQQLGDHYVQGGKVLHLDFSGNPVRASYQGYEGESTGFSYSVLRVDGGSTEVNYRLSVWFDEY